MLAIVQVLELVWEPAPVRVLAYLNSRLRLHSRVRVHMCLRLQVLESKYWRMTRGKISEDSKLIIKRQTSFCGGAKTDMNRSCLLELAIDGVSLAGQGSLTDVCSHS